MALIKCHECGKRISSKAASCPGCGNPLAKEDDNTDEGMLCSHCKMNVRPVVTSVGGGSCSFGQRDTWRCPKCGSVLLRKGCFVATATYGDEDIVEVRFLRAFRDDVLSLSWGGRLLIWVYYHLGAYAAEVVELFPPLKSFSRLVLDNVIKQIEKRTHLNRGTFRGPH